MGEGKPIYWFKREENCQRVAKDSKKLPGLLQINKKTQRKIEMIY